MFLRSAEDLQCKRILVAGDFMLDVYTVGEVQRISPEAPVPVLRVLEESHRPGGAGNTLLNLISLGMEVVAVGRIGNDWGGERFLQTLEKEGVSLQGILHDPSYRTPVKNRMIATGQQLLRVDFENPMRLTAEAEDRFSASLPSLFEGIDVVAISDYAKGFLTFRVLEELIHYAKEKSIPVIVDPKGRDFSRYEGATVLKPNLSEAVAAAGLGAEATLDEVAHKILKDVSVDNLMITRSDKGISLYTDKVGDRKDFPAQLHEIKDVTGAGDTVLAVIAAALANHFDLSEAAQLANIAAGIAIERLGCARISLADLATRLLKLASV